MIEAALIVVDLQIDFCPGGALAVPEGDRIVPLVNLIAPHFTTVVATQDWHPDSHVSFASAHPGSRPFESVRVDGMDQTLWPDHCVAGSPGARLHPDLRTEPIDLILRKGCSVALDSYSAFLENDHRTSTGLAGYLRDRSVSTVYVTGLAADVCVRFTAIDALALGFETFVITDATRAVDQPPGLLEEATAQMRAAGVHLVESADLRLPG